MSLILVFKISVFGQKVVVRWFLWWRISHFITELQRCCSTLDRMWFVATCVIKHHCDWTNRESPNHLGGKKIQKTSQLMPWNAPTRTNIIQSCQLFKTPDFVGGDQNYYFLREKLDVWRECVWKHAKAYVTWRNRACWQLCMNHMISIKIPVKVGGGTRA